MKTIILILCLSLTSVLLFAQSSTLISRSGINNSSSTAECTEKQIKQKGSPDPILIKTCLFENYRSVSNGTPDDKGRYSWEYQLYKKQNTLLTKINNSAMFNQNQAELLSIINKNIQQQFDAYRADKENKDCFDGVTRPGTFKIDDMGIEFDGGNINFNVSLGLGSACMSVDGITVSLRLEDVKPYLYNLHIVK